jgi:hypothetical protein
MLFGMGMTLTPQEDAELARIIRPCFAALALTNDYFSFDRELEDAENTTLINSVSIIMRTQGLDIPSAKEIVRQTIRKYEAEFMRLTREYKRESALMSEKLEQYMEAMSYQVSENLVWSLNCPRYNPDYRYELESCQGTARL